VFLSLCRTIIQARIAAPDIDFESVFTSPICTEHGYSIIIDGKAMGVNRKLTCAACQMVLQLSMVTSAKCLLKRCASCSYHARPNAVLFVPHTQVVPLPESEARHLLEELATGRMPMGSYHELQALCDKVSSQLGLLLSDICMASGPVALYQSLHQY